MAKRKKREDKNAATAEEPAVNRTPLWERSWFPPALFLLLSLVYFSEFVFSDKIIFGSDIGTDFHKGKEPFVEKVQGFVQPAWTTEFGGRALSEEMRFQYFPTQLIYLFTTHQRHLGWRYILTVFLAGWGMYLYMRGLSVNRWAAIWVGWPICRRLLFWVLPYPGNTLKWALSPYSPLCVSCWRKAWSGDG